MQNIRARLLPHMKKNHALSTWDFSAIQLLPHHQLLHLTKSFLCKHEILERRWLLQNSRPFCSLVKAFIITVTCVSCEQCFLIDVRFDFRLCTLSSIVVFIALAFALNNILKSYTLETFMLCNTFMFWLPILRKLALTRNVRWREKKISVNQSEKNCSRII